MVRQKYLALNSQVHYRGHHTCTMSSTSSSYSSPSPPPNFEIVRDTSSTTSSPVRHHWLSTDTRPSTVVTSSSCSDFAKAQMYNFSRISTSSGIIYSLGAESGAAQFLGDSDQYNQPVLEFTDMMFNSAK